MRSARGRGVSGGRAPLTAIEQRRRSRVCLNRALRLVAVLPVRSGDPPRLRPGGYFSLGNDATRQNAQASLSAPTPARISLPFASAPSRRRRLRPEILTVGQRTAREDSGITPASHANGLGLLCKRQP